MSIRVNLPDGSVANFPDGMNPQQIQAEIERHMAQAAPQRRVLTPGQDIARDVNRLRDTIGRGDGEFQENFDWQGEPQPPRQREIPLNAMEQQAQMEAQRRGPQRRNAEISIREAMEPEPQGYQQPTMGATELNQPAMRDAVRGREAPTSEVNTDRGPQRRRAEVSIREALPPTEAAEDKFQENYDWQGDPNSRPAEQPAKDPATMTDAELRAAEIAARNPIGNAGRAIADTFRGATRAAASATQDAIGGAAAALGMPGVGGRLMQGADNIDASLAERRRLEAEERAASDARAQQLTDERARRQPAQSQAPSASAAQAAPAPATPAPGQPATALPSIQNPNAGQRTNVSMPRGLSVADATAEGRQEASRTFNMADGSSQTVPVGKPGKASPQALRNGTKTGMDYILEQGEQYVLQRLKRGDIAGAMEFRNFMRDEQNQRGLENYNRAVVSTTLRDTEAFAKSTAGMVRYLDPDGDWEVDTKGTQLLFTDDGQVAGAEVALKNKRTGETLVNEYQGMKEVLDGLGDFASPTAGIERQRQRVEQAQAQRIENAKNFSTAYDEAVKMMFPDGFVDGQTLQPFTPEQRQQADMAVREYIASSRPDLPQPPPRQAPAGAASGVGVVTGGSSGQPVPTWGG